MKNEDCVRLTLPNDQAYLSMALSFVRTAGSTIGLAGSALVQLEMAVEEAVTNVMKHAYDGEENRNFEIRCEKVAGGIRVVIHERGIPFDPASAPVYQPGPRNLEELDSAGLGLFLMKNMVDECAFRNLGPEGKETVLVKYVGDTQPDADPEPAAPVATPEVIKERIPYEVRRMTAREAIEVCRCAYKSHGYTFFDEHIYYPEKINELNESGQMVSAVAVTQDNKFMGHACLLHQEPTDRIAELTFVFVNVEYRGQGAFTRLLDFLVSTPKAKPLDGLYAYAVANHPFTQKTMARAGINDCGIQLATSPASWKFKGIDGDTSQRISVVMSFKYFQPPKRLVLYPPAGHRAMVEKLFRNVGAQHEFREPDGRQPPVGTGASVIQALENPAEGCTEVFVERYGADPVMDLRRLLRRLCLNGMAAINLFLNLEDPATYFIAPAMEPYGFFFAGILPRARVGDALILQYLNNVDVDYGKICAHTEVAQELLAYIRQRDPNAAL